MKLFARFCFRMKVFDDGEGAYIGVEWLDVYDKNGKRTGRIAERGMLLSDGEYFLCAHILLENTDRLFLIQQRSDQKATRPGQWDLTAGAVDAGETSRDGAVREVQEEVGLILPKQALRFLFRDCWRSCFHDVYYMQMPFTLEDCTMQESEVQALRLVSEDQLMDLVSKMPHRSNYYKTRLADFLKNRSKSFFNKNER